MIVIASGDDEKYDHKKRECQLSTNSLVTSETSESSQTYSNVEKCNLPEESLIMRHPFTRPYLLIVRSVKLYT